MKFHLIAIVKFKINNTSDANEYEKLMTVLENSFRRTFMTCSSF